MYYVYEGHSDKVICSDGFAYDRSRVLHNPNLALLFKTHEKAMYFIQENKRWVEMGVAPISDAHLAAKWHCEYDSNGRLYRRNSIRDIPPGVRTTNVAMHILHSQSVEKVTYVSKECLDKAVSDYCEKFGSVAVLETEPKQWSGRAKQ